MSVVAPKLNNTDVKCGSLSPDDLRAVQLIQLEMLNELDRVCKKHNIRYCLIAGTMLGAVRHKGFIPWDDDIDVGMTRVEYERFRAACERDLDASRFFFQDDTTDEYYPWGYGRMRRVGSEFIRVGQEHLKMRTGIFLDVFPLDGVPNFPPLRGIFTTCCFFLRKVLYAEVGAVSAKNGTLRVVYKVLCLIPKRWTFRRLKQLTGIKKSKYVRILTFPTPKGRPFGYWREWYENTADIEFEGRKFPGIRDYDAYLTYKFGDYMTLPPIEQRHWHPAAVLKFPIDKEGN